MKTHVLSTVSFTEIHHLARLNWEQDGCPEGLDMEYYLAAESLLVKVRPRKTPAEGKTTSDTMQTEASRHQANARRPGHSSGTVPVGRKYVTAAAHANGRHSGERTLL